MRQVKIFEFPEQKTDSGQTSTNNQDEPEASTSAGSCEERFI
jgi:hypothetical protein